MSPWPPRPARRSVAVAFAALTAAFHPFHGRAQTLTAPQPGSSSRIVATVFAGGAAFTGLQGVWVEPSERTDGSGRYAGSMAARAAGVFGGSVAWWPRDWGVRVGGSYIPTRLEVRMSPEARQALGNTRVLDPGLDRFDAWTAEAAALVRLPLEVGQLYPYALVSLGAMGFRVASADSVTSDDWRVGPAAGIGVGAIVPLTGSRLGLSFELTDRLSRTPIPASAGASSDLAHSPGIVVVVPGDGGESGNFGPPSRVSLVHQVRITAGFTYRLGGA